MPSISILEHGLQAWKAIILQRWLFSEMQLPQIPPQLSCIQQLQRTN